MKTFVHLCRVFAAFVGDLFTYTYLLLSVSVSVSVLSPAILFSSLYFPLLLDSRLSLLLESAVCSGSDKYAFAFVFVIVGVGAMGRCR